MSRVKFFLGGHASSFLLFLKFYEVTFETRQIWYMHIFEVINFKSEESPIIGIFNPGFWDFWLRYFCIVVVKKVYQSVTTLSSKKVLSKVFIQSHLSSGMWLLSLLLLQLAVVFHKAVLYSALGGSSLIGLVIFTSSQGLAVVWREFI